MARFLTRRTLLLLAAKTLPQYWAARLHNPVFIIGSARSGTTVLTELLSFHRDIADLSEANDVWDPTGYPWSESSRETPPLWIDPIAHTQRWWRDTEPRQQELRAIFGAYQTLLRKKVFLNKTPLNTFRIPYLLKIFPDARFIHIIRDGRATVHSYVVKQLKDINSHPEPYRQIDAAQSADKLALQLAWFWQENLKEVGRQDAAHKLTECGKLLEVTYEDLCADVHTTLNQICKFISINKARCSTRSLPEAAKRSATSNHEPLPHLRDHRVGALRVRLPVRSSRVLLVGRRCLHNPR